jgi:hypothetical protein
LRRRPPPPAAQALPWRLRRRWWRGGGGGGGLEQGGRRRPGAGAAAPAREQFRVRGWATEVYVVQACEYYGFRILPFLINFASKLGLSIVTTLIRV